MQGDWVIVTGQLSEDYRRVLLRRRIDASVLLVKALGGGWDVAALPTPEK